jgi:preprotein translocase subunit YajC
MNLFPTALADEVAQTAPVASGSAFDPMLLIIMVVGFFLFFIFVMKPNSKREKEHRNAINQISVGDEVLTSGGIIGRVVKESEDKSILSIQINENSVIMIKRAYIASALPKGTYEQYQVQKK